MTTCQVKSYIELFLLTNEVENGIMPVMSDKPVNPFRSPNGTRWTKQLFLEMWQDLPVDLRSRDPLYTLMHERHGLPCFRKLYVAFGDPTGYQLATEYLEDYNHWELLLKSSWFREAKEVWDRELDAKLASEGMRTIRAISDGVEGSPLAVQLTASRYLADKAYRKDNSAPAKRGRPSKAEVAGNLERETQSARDIAADLARIRKA